MRIPYLHTGRGCDTGSSDRHSDQSADKTAPGNADPDEGTHIYTNTMADSTADQADACLAPNACTYPLSTRVPILRIRRG